jgi:hypothetical protein
MARKPIRRALTAGSSSTAVLAPSRGRPMGDLEAVSCGEVFNQVRWDRFDRPGVVAS